MRSTFLHLIASLFLCAAASKASDQDHIHPYVFMESTGDNQFTLFQKKLEPIRKFSAQSNQKALAALKALKAEVLYPNSDGTKIFLIGSYDPKDKSFTLESWFIRAPFKAADLEPLVNGDQRREEQRETLLDSDFRPSEAAVRNPGMFVLDDKKTTGELRRLQQEADKK